MDSILNKETQYLSKGKKRGKKGENLNKVVESSNHKLGLTGQMKDIFFDRIRPLSLPRVHVGDSLGPCLRVRQGEIDDVALSDVTGEDEGGKNGEMCPGIFEI